MKKNLNVLLSAMILIALLALTGCGGSVTDPDVAPPTEAQPVVEPTQAVQEEAPVVEEPEITLAKSLELNIAMGNNQRTITYQQATPLELPDGTVITQGMLKPTWQYISDQLGIEFIDVTIQDQRAGEMIDVAAATGFDNAVVFGGNSIGADLMNYGTQGYFVRLSDHLDQMPNFAAYLEANPNIAAAITAYDGGIYHIPYAAELNNYARVFCGRESWITALLDSDDALEPETHTLTPVYEGYWDRRPTNVIDLQNEAAAGTLTRDIARDTLLAYIAETYPDLEQSSDLYLNETATYDIDELVALWRVVELSPNTLSKLTTGKVVDGAVIYPFFTRRAVDRGDLFQLITYFGGQRVYGSDSYDAWFYLDANGELQFSHAEDGFLKGVGYLADLYKEGLIFPEFSDLSNEENFRTMLYARDTEEAHLQFGFMTFDWIASTTASNPDVVGMLPPLTTVGSDEFIHFVANTRVIKPDGWAISVASTPEEINAALALFDYFFTKEGNVVQNYAPPYALVEGEVYRGADGIDYPQFQQWILDAATENTSGDLSAFLRDYMGSQIPIGYQKEIGFEFQYTKNRGWDAWALYIGQDVATSSYEAENPLFRLVPPIFSLTEQDTAKLGQLSVGHDQEDQIYMFITGAGTAVDTVEDLKALYVDAGLEKFLEVYRNAYARMIE